MAEDILPPYSEATHPETVVQNSSVPSTPVLAEADPATAPITVDVVQQPKHAEDRQNTASNNIIGIRNASHSFSGFIDILYVQRKLPQSCPKNIIYKLVLFIYYLANFVYSIVTSALQKELVHPPYHISYIVISSIGLLFESIVILIDLKSWLTWRNDEGEDAINLITNTKQTGEACTAYFQAQNYLFKAQSVFKDYVASSVGEFLIYPTLICVLYGFIINERAWEFDNTVSICHVVFLAYSVIMDALYMKFYVIWLVIRVIRASYVKYDELVRPTEVEWKRYFTPVYLTIPFAIMTALTHWFMTGIIGVRIYIDNFTLEKDDTNSTDDINSIVPNTGDYSVAPLTGIMMGCAICLPIVSWVAYIIINKEWFYEVFSAINQLTTIADQMPPQVRWDKKFLATYKNPLAYIGAILLMGLFVAFVAGTYLWDCSISDYEVTSSAQRAIDSLASWFIGVFLLSNIQSVIISTMVLFVVVIGIFYGFAVLCYRIHTLTDGKNFDIIILCSYICMYLLFVTLYV